MRLKSIAALLIGTLSLVALVVSVSLILMTTALHRSSVDLLVSTRSIVATEELETNLLVHSRESLLWMLTGDRSHLTNRHKARENLTRWFDESRRHIGSDHERQLLLDAEDAVDRYFDTRAQLERSNASLNEIATGIADETDEAIRRLQLVTDLNLDQVDEQILLSKKTDAFATLMGSVAAVLILCAIPLVAWMLRRMVYKPVLEIARAVQGFRRDRAVARPIAGAIELKDIAAELADMTSELVRQREVQLRYLSAVAHDLRNPIGAIKMSAELMLLEFGSAMPSDAKEMLEVTHRQSTHLERMVSDLLDTARSETGELGLKKSVCDLNALVRECTDLFSRYSASHRIVLTGAQGALLVEIDPVRVAQVINNLISNAIKYSPYGGQVDVSIKANQGGVAVTVRDSGIGISAEDQQAIFEPFRRAPATKDTIPGVGLGLFTARKIVLAHGGRIEVESSPREGSKFTVWLPSRSVDTPPAVASAVRLPEAVLH
jgi:signal transduction histidine kinase